MDLLKYEIDEDNEGERIDKFISGLIDSFSRSYLQKLIDSGDVTVNGNIIKSSYKLKLDDIVLVKLPDAITPDIKAENIPLDILYEDNDVIVINKPKNMVVHPSAGHYEGTMVNALMYHCKDNLSGINGVLRPGIVHRIDKNTTGSVIVCKNDYAHQKIAEQLKNHTVIRRYHAIVNGIINEDEGTIRTRIGRNPKDRLKMAVVSVGGKEAITHFKVLKRFNKHTYIECSLETGRTHQIRVHMAHINHPILGDDLYSNIPNAFKLEGQCLHAKILGFIHPVTNEYIETDADLPEYFKHLLDIL